MLVLFAIIANIFTTVTWASPYPMQTLQKTDDAYSRVPDCKSGSGKVPILVPNPLNCRSLFICSDGVLKEFYCPEGKIFNPERQECVKGNCKRGNFKKWPAFESCPDDWSIPKYFKHPEDCTRYYQCDNGFAVLMRCGPDTLWNDDLKTCDHPWNVTCESRSFIKRTDKSARLRLMKAVI